MFRWILTFVLVVTATCYGEGDLEDKEEKLPPRPYSFAYKAGRFPGHSDRIHAETSDGNGVVKGLFSYVDPANRVRTVEYVADQDGFRPILSHQPQETKAVAEARARHEQLYAEIASGINAEGPRDTEAVKRAKVYHQNLFEKIAAEHARIAQERKNTIEEEEVV